jgi:hypothetical protein
LGRMIILIMFVIINFARRSHHLLFRTCMIHPKKSINNSRQAVCELF